MSRLKDKVALITGGTSGIGLATARRFIEEGARVAITGTNTGRLEEVRKILGDDTFVIAADAGDVTTQNDIARQIGETFGRLDAVFLNAGIADLRPLDDWTEAAFDRSIDIDLKGPYFLIKALVPLLSNPSSIILSGSVNAHMGMAGTHVYSLAKAGMISLARTLSGELIGRGIRANVISPGPIDTPLNDKLGLDAEAAKARAEAVVGLVPAGRFGTAEEIANAVVFLASDECPFIVGAGILIDGGLSIA
ncbi:SDR family oxidoreductase [Mesorhizobium sp. M4B.F.Ca.ET.089.01.1.1]|uniref:SDR family oxidoreductase n=1 Tax=Mesorhizobium sp. M4B.F.Ca.ET.089.01.1.1 TaxID=2496662 RepID=UPI000FE3CB86|nr:SDR family oxidoreductase [Mesorhizobium sp. M4B.F.Ca.ET.089.01.1.1]RWX67711.1 SDR family oxidoreductase [Mesorhizobium sp. M4B.F.Ca.ET.089.01.1.1]